MDINSRIKWTPGMELSASTLSALDDNFDLRQLISVRTANGLRVGRIPGSVFRASGAFVKSSFEIERLQCMALLSSGMLVSVDERVKVPVSPTSETYAYLTVGFGADLVEYEAHEQRYLRPTYAFQFQTLSEIDSTVDGLDEAVFPVLRFKLGDGRIAVDPAYIAPCLIMQSDNRLMQFKDAVVAKLETIVNHQNMEEGDCKRMLLRAIFGLKSFSSRNLMETFMKQLHEIASAIKYYIMTPNGDNDNPVRMWTQYDVERWLSWFDGFLDKAVEVLDGVELVDKTIDYDKLKEELRKEILDTMLPDMLERINKVKEILNEELGTKLSEVLHDYIDGTFRQQLHDTIHTELTDELRQPMYDGLYQALYDALYVPVEEEEDNFMPLI